MHANDDHTRKALRQARRGIPPVLLRQLLAFRDGGRANDASQQMKPVLEKLSLNDMIDVVAYLGSLYPPQ